MDVVGDPDVSRLFTTAKERNTCGLRILLEEISRFVTKENDS